MVAACLWAATAGAEAPARVVSLNLCTDQLAMLLAAPGQLVSVSELARDPRSSVLAETAQGIPTNNGSAEAVLRLRPDLVLAGTYTTRATVEMLTRLNIPVVQFAPENTLDDVRTTMLRMGGLLGRDAHARAMVQAFNARLSALTAVPGPAPRSALYYALGTTAGAQTLPGALLDAAGYANIAAERGLPFGGALPLETLLLDAPDLILVGRPYRGHARATELLAHPALRRSGALRQIENGAAWACGAPALLDAVAELIEVRQAWDSTP